MKEKATIELTKEQAEGIAETLLSSEDTELALKVRKGEFNITAVTILKEAFK